MNANNTLTFLIYCRKSSEDDRQAASIGDQLRELMQLVERERLALATDPLTEEKSAKAPGRPTFTELLRRIERGEANGILCWDIDRLYRNPVDEGRVRWLLQRGVIQQIRTPFRIFLPQDAGLLMGVEGGRATDHIITLRKGVLRGFRGKLEKGQRPGVAPPGYLNNMEKTKGQREIIPDRERFPVIRQAWDLMLTGQYSIREIYDTAANQWGLRSRPTKRLGGRPYAHSTWYRIFTDPFYAGQFWWKDPDTGERKLYRGAHAPMITLEEFDRVQVLLGSNGKPLFKSRRLPFTGLIRCGECHSMITGEVKYHVVCSSCKLKFSAHNSDCCPRCDTAIADMAHPVRRFYTYYRCSKPRRLRCSQPCIRVAEFEGQVERTLATVTISEDFKDWAIAALAKDETQRMTAATTTHRSLEQRVCAIRRQLEHVNAMILSPDTDWTLIGHDEIKQQKTKLITELETLECRRRGTEEQTQTVLELSANTFEFAAYAQFWFREGNAEQKRAILAALASNLVLKDKTLIVELRKPLRYLSEALNDDATPSPPFEPLRNGSAKRESPPSQTAISSWRRGKNAVRTFWEENLLEKPLPSFPIPSS